MDEAARCSTCGEPLPCDCAAKRRSTFVLLPALDDEDCEGRASLADFDSDVDDEERFTRLLREVKASVLKRDFVELEGARTLSRTARRLEVEVRRGDLRRADSVATNLVSTVLDLPERPASHRAVVVATVICAVVLATVLVASLVLTLASDA